MAEKRYLHCKAVCTDGSSRLNRVERLQDGRLFTLACFCKDNRGGQFSKEPVSQYVMGRVSEDEGRTWRMSGFIHELPDTIPMAALLAFMVDRDGRIHAFFTRISRICWEDSALTKGDIAYLRMDDETGRNLVYRKIGCLDRYTGSVLNMVQLESGRIVVPFSTIAGVNGSTFVSETVYSDDGGDTWHVSNDVEVESDETHLESGAVEPVVARVAPGVLVMLIRTVLNRIWYSVSYDDGASWSSARPTRIPSSNAPSVPLLLPDSRLLLLWNNVLGEPMHGVRYSFARQCLHAAVSRDGLKTLEGVRVIVRKRASDPDDQLNCYPFASLAGNGEVFVRPFSVNNDGVHWGDPQATLLRLAPDDLLENEIRDGFDEWITDCATDAAGVHLRAEEGGTAYACVNFPYAEEGEIDLAANQGEGADVRLLLSDCYLDRLNFLPGKNGARADAAGKPFVEAALPRGSRWRIAWDGEKLVVAGDETRTLPLVEWGRGFNHMILLLRGRGALDVTGFHMKAVRAGMKTGIEY